MSYRYKNENQMPPIMHLITKDLSEPYSIYTYRYFIHNWPKLCFLVSLLWLRKTFRKLYLYIMGTGLICTKTFRTKGHFCPKHFLTKGHFCTRVKKWIKKQKKKNILPHTQGIQGNSGNFDSLFLIQGNSGQFWFFLKISGKF